jgi:RNA methyltransferase, TrmH family
MIIQPATARMLSQASGLKIRKYRDNEGLILLEGERLVRDALRAQVPILHVIVSDSRLQYYSKLVAECSASTIPVYVAPDKQFLKLADTRQPQGIAAVAPIPSTVGMDDAALVSDIPVVALHGVADPGNLGTIIRAMDWFGVSLLLLSSGSVDPWNPKVVRSAMGSMFRVRVLNYGAEKELLRIADAAGRTLIAAVADSGRPLPELHPMPRPLLLFGSEAHGLPAALLESAHERVTIPGSGAAESLNLAMSATIVLYAFHAEGKAPLAVGK